MAFKTDKAARAAAAEKLHSGGAKSTGLSQVTPGDMLKFAKDAYSFAKGGFAKDVMGLFGGGEEEAAAPEAAPVPVPEKEEGSLAKASKAVSTPATKKGPDRVYFSDEMAQELDDEAERERAEKLAFYKGKNY
jgi:hypothetical protein